jgi:hypothetical protein
MKAILSTVATMIFALGIATVLLGLVMIGYGTLAPTQPLPSLNEGHAYAFVLGIVVTFVGLVGVAFGKAMKVELVHEIRSPYPADGSAEKSQGKS